MKINARTVVTSSLSCILLRTVFSPYTGRLFLLLCKEGSLWRRYFMGWIMVNSWITHFWLQSCFEEFLQVLIADAESLVSFSHAMPKTVEEDTRTLLQPGPSTSYQLLPEFLLRLWLHLACHLVVSALLMWILWIYGAAILMCGSLHLWLLGCPQSYSTTALTVSRMSTKCLDLLTFNLFF